jgi:hypothetical protein
MTHSPLEYTLLGFILSLLVGLLVGVTLELPDVSVVILFWPILAIAFVIKFICFATVSLISILEDMRN